eukprot:TRINITY_DN3632_c0_g3_i1.p1 TRINITY_DN3632_c0_g3~~TRINITY_DN3632_c0_g3_i1.p1  ORF type:complete len:525 (+),score=117.86 TRINITY_DN3632_c0_g3_i1:81-1655(+)
MGASPSSGNSLTEVTDRATEAVGAIAIHGRYHRLPARLEDDYIVQQEKKLGVGYNGAVVLAQGRHTHLKYAVKSFKLHGVAKDKREELEAEAEIFLRMDHPHVVRLYDVYESEDKLSLVMECMDGGELFDRVQERKVFSEKDACNASWMMLLAVNYIHSCSVVHRDLKLENFLYEKKDSDFLKLIDFGFSKIWEKNTRMELSCGTLSYAAPEVLAKNYTSQCDLWSLGVIVFILLVGYMPFPSGSGGDRAQISLIRAGKFTMRKERWDKVSGRAFDFVKSLLVVDPERRLTAQQALEHPWIKGRDEDRSGHFDAEMVSSLCKFSKAQKFRRSCMQLMAWSLTAEDRAQVREAFLELDTSRSGQIKLIDLKHVLESKFDLPEDHTMAVFQALDSAPDDEIHYSDFLAAMMSSRIKLYDELLQECFRRFDHDYSGYISEADLKRVLGTDYDVSEIMKTVDINHDGKISSEEFLRYLKSGEATENHMEAVERAISREIDANPALLDAPGRLRKRDRIKNFFTSMFSS